MKKKFTILISAALMLLTMMAQPGTAWGQKDYESSFEFNLNELYQNGTLVTTKTVISTAGETLSFNDLDGNFTILLTRNSVNQPGFYTSSGYIRFYNSDTFKLSAAEGITITKIVISPNGSSFYLNSLEGLNTTTRTWEGSASEVTFTGSGTNKWDKLTITFTSDGPIATPTTVTINASGITNTDLYAGTEAGSLSATVKDNSNQVISGATVAWSSSDTGVATIDGNGVVTLVAEGTTTITASYAGNGTYGSSSATYSLVVTDSTPITGGGNVTFNANSDLGNATAGEGSITKNDVTLACSNGILGNGSEYRFYKNSTTTISTTSGTITSIAFTCKSGNPASGFATQSGFVIDGSNGTWTGSATSVSFVASNKQVQATKVVVTISDGTEPYITAEDVEIEYNATFGSIIYTINNAPTPAGTLTASSSDSWITIGTIGQTVPFTCTANPTADVRTATVALTYTYGDNQTATKSVTVTQAGNPTLAMTIAAARAQGTGSVVTKGIVTSSAGTTGYIQDATAAICVYGTSLTVGDEILVSGTLALYNGLLEITDPQVTVLSQGNTIQPELMTIAEINASTNQGWYIRVENATVTAISGSNTTIAQNGNTIVVRSITGVDDIAINDIISLDGNIGCFNVAQIANPTNVTVQHVMAASITVEPASVNVPFEGSYGTLNVTYNYFTTIDAEIYYCNASGEAATYDWLEAEIDGNNNVYYMVDSNEGNARQGYFKVTALDNNGNTVYSNLVAIYQAKYVAPTYATLPFAFNGGKADIADTDGLYQEGLGNDYSSQPKLKFDGTGDYLLLQFQETPGKLTYDIKGNGFSGSTFKLQTSVNGVNYTDLKTYVDTLINNNASQHESFNLDGNVRYVKWVYIEKVGGNVALGNIALNEPAVPHNLTIASFENLEITTFVETDDEPALVGAGTIQVLNGDQVMLSIIPNEGYVIESLIVNGEEHANDIENALYTFAMPNQDVTVTATAVLFVPVTYTLATSIKSGKTYIIVGSKIVDGETEYYAMGAQRDNNRAGVLISMEDNTTTVETQDVYEFTISALEAEGFYSIYDARTPGYLYAAATGSNYLKTETELDENHNGDWAISIDDTGEFSIAAINSGNRNVMQFNGNGSGHLFSCYAEATLSPVYLYERVSDGQTATLFAGWNWFSTFIMADDPIDALVNLETSLEDHALQISSSFDGTTEYDDGEWIGDLDEVGIFNEQMYLIFTAEDCSIELEGLPTTPELYEITINPGWNWIGFPSGEEIEVNVALANFEAEIGDMIASQFDGVAEYDDEWIGELETFVPGQGYLYYSASDDTKVLIINTTPIDKAK